VAEGGAAVYLVQVRLEGDEVAKGERRGKVKLGMTAQVEVRTARERILKLFFKKVREKISLN